MIKGNLLVKGIVVGAVIGGSLTLLDRETRERIVIKAKRANHKLTYFRQHPSDFVAEINHQYQAVSTKVLRGFDTTSHLMSEIQNVIDQTDENQ